ncbi:MAG TPA: N-acetyl-gamma-glutamyl-phosphate reductase [Acidimicrobiales bacterium]|nr:N-acetyl-gamma-glutamyl-phosphate reductase [Acidimicrobiales bacterium]
MRVAVVGATGYAGLELLRLMASHEHLEVVLATGESNAGRRVRDLAPALAALYPSMVFAPTDEVFSSDAEVVFLALPHGHSQRYVGALRARGVAVVDLGADFRLEDAQVFEQWYGEQHQAADLLGAAVYGLVERHRVELAGSSFIAVPGCFPTAAALALGPFVDADVIERTGVVINALSGASGAGRSPSERLHYPRLAGNAEAYGLLRHRHTPEIQQELQAEVLFTPHLVASSRGMLVTAYARVRDRTLTSDSALGLLRTAYAYDPCIVVVEEPPTLKDPVGSNLCYVSARVDERTGWLIAMSSIDNLIKGAAGQALQAWNVACGLDERTGLPMSGVTP